MYRFWVCLLFITSSLAAIDVNLPPGATAIASANMTSLNKNPSAVFNLPSQGTSGYESSLQYLFSESDLPLYSLFMGHDLWRGTLVIGAEVLSHPLYQENHVLVNYHGSWSLLSFGVNERFLSVSVSRGTRSSSLVTDCGLGLSVSAFETSVGIHNIFRSTYQDVVLPEIYVAEMSYEPFSNASIGLGCEKQQAYDASLRLATKYQVSSVFNLVAGYQYQPDRFSGGLEFTCKRWVLCYALQTHPELALTHAISITWK
jgi:hypothetical protein